MINVNAYHQPGVEAGKKAATAVLQLQTLVTDFLKKNGGKSFTSSEIANGVKKEDQVETIFRICQHLAAMQQISVEEKNLTKSRYRANPK